MITKSDIEIPRCPYVPIVEPWLGPAPRSAGARVTRACIERLGGKMAFERINKRWHKWTGTSWEVDEQGRVSYFIGNIASELNHKGNMKMGSWAFVDSVRSQLQKLPEFLLLPVDAFMLRHAGKLLYDQKGKRWLRWDVEGWQPTPTVEVNRLIREVSPRERSASDASWSSM